MTVTTPDDYNLTNNTNPIQGKIEVATKGTLTIRKIGINDADITFTDNSLIIPGIWNHILIKFDTTNMTVS